MAKGQTGSDLAAWVPGGLKVRTAAPEAMSEIVAEPVSQTRPEPVPVAKQTAVPLSVLDTKPIAQTDVQKRRATDHFPLPAAVEPAPETETVSAAPPQTKPDSKPGFWPMPILSFFSFICFCILMALGQWQWDKYVLKSKAPTEVVAVEPTPVAAGLEAASPEYRPVVVEGLIDPRTIKISVVQEGVRGYRLFSPVVMEAGGIFVDRGFVSEEEVLNVVAPSGQVQLTGVLRSGAKANRYTPDNDPAADIWYWPDLTAMADMLVIQTVSAQYYVAQSDVDPLAKGTLTANPYADSKGTSRIEPGTHLGYALQWWGFGLALIGVYIGLHVRTGRLRFRAAPSS
jgi:surfeit locus 1 family protein